MQKKTLRTAIMATIGIVTPIATFATVDSPLEGAFSTGVVELGAVLDEVGEDAIPVELEVEVVDVEDGIWVKEVHKAAISESDS